MAFRTILGALSFIVQRFDTLGGLVAETSRITALEEQLTSEGRYATHTHTHTHTHIEREREELRCSSIPVLSCQGSWLQFD